MSDSGDQNHRSEACPAVETLRAFAAGLLTVNNLGTVIDHLYVRTCQRCSELLLAFPETTASVLSPPPILHGPDEVPTVPVRTSRPRWIAGPTASFQGLRLGRYTIRALVGKGGFGAVYAAFDEELHREVAVKVPFECGLGREELAKVTAEARLHASLDHPNIVPIYDVGHTPDIPVYWVSKLVLGQNLARRIEKSRLTAREAVLLVLQVADALEHMRLRGLVHLDIKPRNILLDMHGTPFLTDFGLAMKPTILAEGAPEDLQFAGTLPYMSPEQARGEISRVDHRSDVYSLGVVLYELLTGQRPFRGDTTKVREAILNKPPQTPRELDHDVPPELEAVCLKALEKLPERRYQQARHMAEDLRRWVSQERSQRPVHVLVPLTMGSPRALMGLGCVGVMALSLLAWATRMPALPDNRMNVTVNTSPAKSIVTYIPLHEVTGEPQPTKAVRGEAGAAVKLNPGQYLVVAVAGEGPGRRFHEVFRYVPADPGETCRFFEHEQWSVEREVVTLPPIALPAVEPLDGMCLFPSIPAYSPGGTEFKEDVGAARAKGQIALPAFYLDTTEVRAATFAKFMHPGRENAIPPGHPDLPASSVSWGEAVSCAERMGKRLPDEWEFEYAATALGKTRFPWGDKPAPWDGLNWSLGAVKHAVHDQFRYGGQPTVYGLYSNLAEWTSSWGVNDPTADPTFAPGFLRVIRGGPPCVLDGNMKTTGHPLGAEQRFSMARYTIVKNKPGLGFRCAKSVKPRLEPADFAVWSKPERLAALRR